MIDILGVVKGDTASMELCAIKIIQPKKKNSWIFKKKLAEWKIQ